MLNKKVLILLLIIFILGFKGVFAQEIDLRKPSKESAAISLIKKNANGNKLIGLTLKDADLKQVLRMLAEKAGVNIVFQSTVSDIVTLDMAKVSVADAMGYILDINNLSYEIKYGTLLVKNKKTKKNKVSPKKIEIVSEKLEKMAPVIERETVKQEPKEISTLKVDYVSAFYVSDFLNTTFSKKDDKEKLIATAQGLNDIVLVATKEEIEKAREIIEGIDVKPKVAVFDLNYISPEKMAEMININILNSRCSVCASVGKIDDDNPFLLMYDNKNNKLTISGVTSEQLKIIKEYISKIDVKLPQAVLEVLMVELSSRGVNHLNDLIKFDKAFDASGLNLGVYKPNRDILDNVDCLLSSEKNGKILARPKITISNGGFYEVNLTSDYVESKESKHVYNISKDQGVNLKIYSKINRNKDVFLTLEPSYQTVKRFIPSENRPKATLLNRKSFKLRSVRLKNGETLGLGGLVTQKEYLNTPVLRWFGLGRKKIKESEFLIFVKVCII